MDGTVVQTNFQFWVIFKAVTFSRQAQVGSLMDKAISG